MCDYVRYTGEHNKNDCDCNSGSDDEGSAHISPEGKKRNGEYEYDCATMRRMLIDEKMGKCK